MTLTIGTSVSLLDHTFRGISFDSPGDVWLALTDAAGSEVTFAGYARVRLDDKLGDPENGVVINNATVEFPVAEETWSVRGIAIYGSESGSDRLQSAPLRRTIGVTTNASLRFLPVTLRIFIGSVPDGVWQGGTFIKPYQEADPVTFGFPGFVGENTFHINYVASDLAGATFETASTIL